MSGNDTGNNGERRANEQPSRDLEPGQVSAHDSTGDRVVFTEAGNSEGWIATDTTVEVER